MYKPADTPAVEAAKQTLLGRVYLDWGTWAVVRDVGQEPVAGMDPPNLPPNRIWTTVEFTDLRFDYPFLATRSAPRTARRSAAGSTSSTAATTRARLWPAVCNGRFYFPVESFASSDFCTAKQVYEMASRTDCIKPRSRLKNVPQGLKPRCLCTFRGTAKAVPFQKPDLCNQL